MVGPKPNEIVQAEQLMNESKTEEALEIVREFQQSAWPYFFKRESNKALEITEQSKELMEKIGEEIDLANNFFLMGYIYLQKGNLNESLKYGMESVKIHEKINNRDGLESSLSLVGNIHWYIGNFIEALEYCERSLTYSKNDIRIKASNLRVLGNIHLIRGELTQALKYSEEGMKLANEGKYQDLITSFRCYLGNAYKFMGEYIRAIEYLNPNLIETKISFPFQDVYKGIALFTLITIYHEMGDDKMSHYYLDQFEEFAKEKENKDIRNFYFVAKGILLLNESSRTRDRAEAEKLFKKVVEDAISVLPLYLYALWGLICTYIEELGISNDLEILEDINPLIDRYLSLAYRIKSSIMVCEVHVFKSKLALVQLNFDEAKLLLTQAQQIAESHNLGWQAHRISNYHDELLEQQDRWNYLKNTNAPISERIEIASFDGILNQIQGKRLEESIVLIHEEPVLLLIITKGGFLIFSYPFTDEWKHDTEIFGSFLSAFTSFSDEFFSKGLDRAKFGEDTLLMQSVGNYSIGYLYKGQSYPAKQKLTTFTKEIQDNTSIWQNFEKFVKTSQVAQVKDLPQIKNLINDIFNV